MTGPEARKQLALLINSQFPLIYLETWEERRATEILTEVAADLSIPFFVWTVTLGMARAGGAPIYNTHGPLQVLAEISALQGDGLYLLKDFHKHLEDSTVVRKLRDVTQLFRRARRSIVISARTWSGPCVL